VVHCPAAWAAISGGGKYEDVQGKSLLSARLYHLDGAE
jgi:hypothetical protein